MKVNISKEKIKEIYDKGIEMRDNTEVSAFIKKSAIELGTTQESINRRIYYYCSKHNLLSIGEVISKNNTKKINQIISKNPNNLKECFREYVKTYYPEINHKKDKKLFDKKVYAVSYLWYNRASKHAMCFMTASSKGHVAINRKNTTTVNKTRKVSFMSKLRINVKTFFKNMRES